MDYVSQKEIQGCNMVFFKAHAYGISFCLTWSMDYVRHGKIQEQ